jgi:pyruvate formate lyase activating enzyme
MEQTTGKFYDIQGFSVQDGPGIRLTCFFKGCPLRCPWCHSPESQSFETELNWMELRCVGIESCGLCLGVCPRDAIQSGALKTVSDTSSSGLAEETIQLVSVDKSLCNNCGACARVCPSKALYLCGNDMTIPELMQRILRDVPFYKTSGGGVTFSGGECLWQPAYLQEALSACKASGIHTAVDTTGYAKWEIIESILPYTDLFLYDLKHMDCELHQKVIGVSNQLILENLVKLAQKDTRIHIRIPLIPQFNDSEESIARMGVFIKELGKAVELVQLLPYHTLGTVKWQRLLKDAPAIEAQPPSEKAVEQRCLQLQAFGLEVVVH